MRCELELHRQYFLPTKMILNSLLHSMQDAKLILLKPEMEGYFTDGPEQFETSNESAFSLQSQRISGSGYERCEYQPNYTPIFAPSPQPSLPQQFQGQGHVSQAHFVPTVQQYAQHHYHHVPAPMNSYPTRIATTQENLGGRQIANCTATFTAAAPLPLILPPASEAPRKTQRGIKKVQGGRCMASHSVIEKQRRDRINSLIDEVSHPFPDRSDTLTTPHSQIRDVVPSSLPLNQRPKHVVLEDALEFIKSVIFQSSIGAGSSMQGSPVSSNVCQMDRHRRPF